MFPVSYIIGDVLTEVYGFRVARGVIWLGFGCNALMALLFWIGGLIPAEVFWINQGAYDTILGQVRWVIVGSFAAYLVGEFSNSMSLSSLKIATKGRFLWLRTITSTVVGQDSLRIPGNAPDLRRRYIPETAGGCGCLRPARVAKSAEDLRVRTEWKRKRLKGGLKSDMRVQ